MIIVRNVFHLKFGKTKEALALLKEGIALQKRAGVEMNQRLMTDVVGRYYTLVLELTAPNLAALEANMPKVMGDKNWHAVYEKFSALVDSGHREISRSSNMLSPSPVARASRPLWRGISPARSLAVFRGAGSASLADWSGRSPPL